MEENSENPVSVEIDSPQNPVEVSLFTLRSKTGIQKLHSLI